MPIALAVADAVCLSIRTAVAAMAIGSRQIDDVRVFGERELGHGTQALRPAIEIEPDLALALFVAPVLLDAAFDTSPRDLNAMRCRSLRWQSSR